MMKVSIIQKESDNTNSLVPIRSLEAAGVMAANPLNFSLNLNNQPNLIDDTCNCMNCLAVFFIPFNGKQIPISQKQFDEIMFKGFRPLFPLDKIIPYPRYIPISFPTKTK